MKKIVAILFSLALFCSASGQKVYGKTVPVTWTDSLAGDYSFVDKWSYGENVFTNNFFQLVCDVECPPEIRKMEDSRGRIYDSLIHEYYKLLDTTHHFHTMQCEGWCYEFGGMDFIEVLRRSKTGIYLESPINDGTHSSLRLAIENNVCTPTIKLTSEVSDPDGKYIFYYHCTGGYIKIDKAYWQRGIMKAEFDFTFFHPEHPKLKMYWKGKIYCKM